MQDVLNKLSTAFNSGARTFRVPLPGGLSFEPTAPQAVAIVFLIFLLILMMGQLRRRLIDWQFKGIVPGVALGFGLALVLEGFAIVGGRTLITETLGWKNAPKPLVNVLDAGKNSLTDVLGASSKGLEIQSMNAQEIDELRELICKDK